jgi:hypothetical protein
MRGVRGEVRLLSRGGALLVQGRESERRSSDLAALTLLGLPMSAMPGCCGLG